MGQGQPKGQGQKCDIVYNASKYHQKAGGLPSTSSCIFLSCQAGGGRQLLQRPRYQVLTVRNLIDPIPDSGLTTYAIM